MSQLRGDTHFQMELHNFLPRYLEPAFAEQASHVYLPDLKMTDLEAGASTVSCLAVPEGQADVAADGLLPPGGQAGKDAPR